MPKTDFRKKIGYIGENLAEKWLIKKGYTLIQRNFVIPGGQIDLIMHSPKGELTMFEVKTRRGCHVYTDNKTKNHSQFEQCINLRQLIALRRTAGYFLAMHPIYPICWQLDLIWITLCPSAGGTYIAKIRHFQDILESHDLEREF